MIAIYNLKYFISLLYLNIIIKDRIKLRAKTTEFSKRDPSTLILKCIPELPPKNWTGS